MIYTLFFNLISKENTPIVLLLIDNTENIIDHCSFYNVSFALKSHSSQTQIVDSHFYQIDKIELTEGTSIYNYYMDNSLLHISYDESQIHQPKDRFPPNYYQRYSSYYYGDLTEIYCPIYKKPLPSMKRISGYRPMLLI